MHKLSVNSPAFAEGGDIPERFTCEGADLSPPLGWDAGPARARSFAVILHDPDAKSDFTHWLVWNIPGSVASLPPGLGAGEYLQGTNGFRTAGYRGPCPPPGDAPHRYHFRLFALDTTLELPAGANRLQLEQAMEGHVLAEGLLIGTFARSPVTAG